MKFKIYFLLFLLSWNFAFADNDKMLIVCNSQFQSMVDTFIVIKNNHGIECQKLIIDSIDFQHIKIKIKEKLITFPAQFVLLIGNKEHIPTYHIDEGCSDIFYLIDNQNNIPKITIGRFPIKNENELRTIIQKNISGEHQLSSLCNIASAEKSTLSNKTDYQVIREIEEKLKQVGINTYYELFTGYQNGLDAEGNPNKKDIIEAINAGIDGIFYAGHGDNHGWNTSEFTISDIDSLSNTTFPIIFSAACNNGNFTQEECFAEKWLNANKNGQPIGAKATIMSSIFTEWEIGLVTLTTIADSLRDNISLGELFLSIYKFLHSNEYPKKQIQTWILFGDPSLRIKLPKNNISEKTIVSFATYPNPCKTNINIVRQDDNEKQLFIYNSEGKLILTKYIKGIHSNINIQNFPSGYYILQIDNYCKKIIKW